MPRLGARSYNGGVGSEGARCEPPTLSWAGICMKGKVVENASLLPNGWFYKSVIAKWSRALYASPLQPSSCRGMQEVYDAIAYELTKYKARDEAETYESSHKVIDERMAWCERKATQAYLQLAASRVTERPLHR